MFLSPLMEADWEKYRLWYPTALECYSGSAIYYQSNLTSISLNFLILHRIFGEDSKLTFLSHGRPSTNVSTLSSKRSRIPLHWVMWKDYNFLGFRQPKACQHIVIHCLLFSFLFSYRGRIAKWYLQVGPVMSKPKKTLKIHSPNNSNN